MAVDSRLPHRFAALSERLSMQNGVVLMSVSSVAALVYTHGNVESLVVMYSINVFLTFSLSNLGMAYFWLKHRKEHGDWLRHLPVHVVGLGLCVTILVVTVLEKFTAGGWLTLLVTGILVSICFWVRSHYRRVVAAISHLDVELPDPLSHEEEIPKPSVANLDEAASADAIDRKQAVAALFVGGYGGLGRHALLDPDADVHRPLQGRRLLLGGHHRLEATLQGHRRGSRRARTPHPAGARQISFVTPSGWGSRPTSYFSTGIEVAVEAEKMANEVIQKYPRALFVAGQLIFAEDTFVTRMLHNETAFMVQRRLQHSGLPHGRPCPSRLNLEEGPRLAARPA